MQSLKGRLFIGDLPVRSLLIACILFSFHHEDAFRTPAKGMTAAFTERSFLFLYP